jgi:phosphoenolpyruvate synthase/pyruvate phosphate dikinase
MFVELTKSSRVLANQGGGKAYNLQKLIKAGLPVPAVAVIPAKNSKRAENATRSEISDELKKLSFVKPGRLYAVRSSGVGEDGTDNSYAGIFETYLDVTYAGIPAAIGKVYESRDSSRSDMYNHERSTSVDSMAVIVQEMISPDYAGVAFSVDPVEKDERIALIEIVAGNGESLVSGKMTPSAVRLNKLTGMVRTLRRGKQTIEESVLNEVATLLAPHLIAIEDYYGIPIDIEWAVKGKNVYLLQARPITTLKEEQK